MAVYVTKNILSKMNQMKYPSFTRFEAESSRDHHWQKLFVEGGKSIQLSQAMICRVCGKDGCTPITEKIDNFSIMLAICAVTNVTIDSSDSLPKFICTDCHEKLIMAWNFKKMCEASERKFKRIINPMGDPAMHFYPYSKHDFTLILHDMKMKRMKMEEEKERGRKMSETSQKTREIKCTNCDITFSTKDELGKHRRERLCMRRPCDVCGQLVASIRLHMRQVHKQPSSHKCQACGKEFPVFARLKNHMMIHTNTFNFFCDLCPYKCKHKYYLVMHMRTHTGEKPYKCPQCPATFVNPSNLNKHKLTHQEKQFKCQLCEKAFRTNAGLREHYGAAHLNIKHTCNYCGRDFCYRSDLRKHEIKHHNRIKRDYIGGEPTYKQVERKQKLEEATELEKWRPQEIIVAQPPQIIQATYIDASKEYPTNQAVYYTDVNGMLQPQTLQHIVPQQTVEITLPELTLKKDDGKITYEAHHDIAYF